MQYDPQYAINVIIDVINVIINVHAKLTKLKTRAEVSTLKNAKLCKIGVECVEFMKNLRLSVDLT